MSCFIFIIYCWNVVFHIAQGCWCICTVWSVNSCFYRTCYSSSFSIWLSVEDLVISSIFFTCWIYSVAIFVCVHYRCYCIISRRLVIYFHSNCTYIAICFTRYDSCTFANEFHFVCVFHCVGVILSQIICIFIRGYNPTHVS